MKLRERDIEIDFTDAIDGLHFDRNESGKLIYHDLSEMHRVDFIVEFNEVIVFVEIKDPENPNAQAEGLEMFKAELNGGLLGNNLASKFIDTFFYRWAEDKLSKSVHYLCLITLLESASLPILTDEIAKKLSPVGKQSPRWKRHPLQNCQVLNLEAWNNNFPKWPASRLAGIDLAEV